MAHTEVEIDLFSRQFTKDYLMNDTDRSYVQHYIKLCSQRWIPWEACPLGKFLCLLRASKVHAESVFAGLLPMVIRNYYGCFMPMVDTSHNTICLAAPPGTGKTIFVSSARDYLAALGYFLFDSDELPLYKTFLRSHDHTAESDEKGKRILHHYFALFIQLKASFMVTQPCWDLYPPRCENFLFYASVSVFPSQVARRPNLAALGQRVFEWQHIGCGGNCVIRDPNCKDDLSCKCPNLCSQVPRGQLYALFLSNILPLIRSSFSC